MRKPPVLTADRAAALIPDGATVAVSSSSAIGLPEHLLAAIGAHFETTGHPRGLTTLHAINSGDMSDGLPGVDHLAKPGLLSRIFGGSYPAGAASMAKPAVREMLETDQIAAYLIPTGLMFQLQRAAAARQPGILTDVGIGSYLDPRLEGGRMNRVCPEFVRLMRIDDHEWLFLPAIPVDVALIRATTADPFGNLTFEDEAALLGTLDAAYAAHNNGGLVIAQVKRLRPDHHPARTVHVPGALVDAVVLDPTQRQVAGIEHDPALAGMAHKPIDRIDTIEFGIQKVIARRAALELAQYDIANLGFGISANVPRVLLEEGLHGEVTWVIEQGAVGGLPVTGKPFGAAYNPDAIVTAPDQFTLLQGGGIDIALLSFLEVAANGDVNVSLMPSATHVTAGVGGFADITAHARHLVFSGQFTAGRKDLRIADGRLQIVRDGSIAKFLPQIAQVTWSGGIGRRRGQQVRYVTERCVLELRPAGLTVIELAPGIDLRRDVLDRAGAELLVAGDLHEMDPRIFRPEPMGLRLAPPRRPLVQG